MTTHPSPITPHGVLARAVRAVAAGAARRPRTTILLWLVLVVACVAAGAMTGTKQLTGSAGGVGESAQADRLIDRAGLRDRATESILVRSGDAATTRATTAALQRRLAALPGVAAVRGPRQAPTLERAGGRIALVQATLRGDPDDASDHAAPVERAVAAVAQSHPGARLAEAGEGSFDKATSDIAGKDLHGAELISLPVTLLILIVAFGALVAAAVPLLLGLTSIAAALGALGLVSQIAPTGDATASVIVLIGLAVGVDYSLFYIRREREERRAGRGAEAALEAAAATVGRAVLVSGLSVMVSLAGLLFTGTGAFTSIALATIVVVAVAVIGSLTVLPAVLAKLGDRVDRGRLPLAGRRRTRRGPGPAAALARAVTGRPVAALVTAVCVLAALAVPAVGMRTADVGTSDAPRDTPVVVAEKAIEREFPGAPDAAQLVVRGTGLRGAAARGRLAALGDRARAVAHGRGPVELEIARDGRTAIVSVPMPDRGSRTAARVVSALRHDVTPTASRVSPGARAFVTGNAAGNLDWTRHINAVTPLVIGFVLGLAFLLLVAAFGSPWLAASVIGLNLLSVGAAYGVLVSVFQNHWAESLLGFHSNGAIVAWLPLFAFVILFGLSMDYTVLVLERVREARRAGLAPREAAAAGVAATAGTVTSAAVVMVAVFAIFATLSLLQFKQLGVGLSAAVLLDATVVRGIALPATLALLGERGWRVRPAPRRRRDTRAGAGWDDGARPPVAVLSTHDGR